MTAPPTSVALATIGGQVAASPLNSDYSALQSAVNAIIAILNGQVDFTNLTSGIVLKSGDATHQFIAQWGSTVGVTDGAGLLAVTFGTPFVTAVASVIAVNGDSVANARAAYGVKQTTVNVNGFSFDSGGALSAAYRCNWLAIGY